MDRNNNTPLALETMLAYLQGNLSPEEAALVDERLANSPADADAMEALSLSLDEDGTEGSEVFQAEQDLLSMLDSMEMDLDNEISNAQPENGNPENQAGSDELTSTVNSPAKRRSPFRAYLAIAATILLLLVPTVLMWPGSMTGPEASTAYFRPYPDIISDRSLGVDPTLLEGIGYYNEEQYAQAASTMEGYVNAHPGELTPILYAGISHYAEGNHESAIKHLNIVANSSSELEEVGIWYLSLTHLSKGDKESAFPLLDKLTHSKGKYANQAAELLEDI